MNSEILEIVEVTLNNTGGELDSRVVTVTFDNQFQNPVKTALIEMLKGIDLAAGDTIKVTLL